MTFGDSQEMLFLGREMTTEKNYSEKVAAEIDLQIRGFITRAHEMALKILKTHKAELTAIAKVLVEKETLEHDEFYALLAPYKIKQSAAG